MLYLVSYGIQIRIFFHKMYSIEWSKKPTYIFIELSKLSDCREVFDAT